MSHNNQSGKTDAAGSPSTRLRWRYITALLIVALLTLVSQYYVQTIIVRQRDDATVIDVAGRQRMLSQRIAKLALVIHSDSDSTQVELATAELEEALALWQSAHDLLRFGTADVQPAGSSDRLDRAFEELQFHFDGLLSASNALLAGGDTTGPPLETILYHEKEYLPRMHAIVGMLTNEARNRVATLEFYEKALSCFTILALALEAILVFEPAARRISSQFKQLQAAKQRLKNEFDALNRSTARAEFLPDGRFLNVNERFLKCFGYRKGELLGRHFSVLQNRSGKEDFESIWEAVVRGDHRFVELLCECRAGEQESPKKISAGFFSMALRHAMKVMDLDCMLARTQPRPSEEVFRSSVKAKAGALHLR